jgi:hypothetical protein
MSEPDIAACVPCKDMERPVSCSRVENCGDCGEAVWVSPSTDAVLAEHDYLILCTPCALARMVRSVSEGTRVMGMDSRQAQELLDEGLTHEQLRRMCRLMGTIPPPIVGEEDA